jgi:hypothetical protein
MDVLLFGLSGVFSAVTPKDEDSHCSHETPLVSAGRASRTVSIVEFAYGPQIGLRSRDHALGEGVLPSET